MVCCTLLFVVILGLPKLGYTFWPASFRVDFKDQKTFVISAGEDGEEEEDEDQESEMVRPEDLADIVELADDEERYKPLHSHVEHYNRRAAEAAPTFSAESVAHFQANLAAERHLTEEEKPFIAGFKHQLDKYDFEQPEQVDLKSVEERMTNRTKREQDDDDILGSTQVSGDLVETISSRKDSLPEGESAGHATPHPSDSESRPSETDYVEENTKISFDGPTTGPGDNQEQSGLFDSQQTEGETQQAEEEESYEYENFRAEYEQQIQDAKSNNMSFNYTENGQPEETAGDAIKKMVQFEMPKNCTKEEFTGFGVNALECLAFDYKNAKNESDLGRVLARTWSVVRVWICIYLCIAVPCWCVKGWCCCCFRCGVCFPDDRILEAKHYYANNAPGILVDQPRKKGAAAAPEPIKYKPTLFELDTYDSLESAIRNL